MEITELSPDDAGAVEQVVALVNEVSRCDSPWDYPLTPTAYAGILRYGWDGEPPRAFVARESGALVAVGRLSLSEWDNTHLAWVGVEVAPGCRRQGRGSALLAHLLDRARSAGRTSVGIDGWDSETTRAFAARHGFELRSPAVNRRQHLAEQDRTLVDKLYGEAEAAAAAYELVRVDGRTPDAMLDAVVTMTAAINDAPLDDLEIEDEVFTPERVRAYEDAAIARGERLHRLVARHRETGELAGHTVVAVEDERPGIGHQHDTSVVREHRGHRLGLLLKAGMLRWLAEAEPQLEAVDTWNAESNHHMIAVNEALGYRVLGRGLQFQRSL